MENRIIALVAEHLLNEQQLLQIFRQLYNLG